LTIIAGYNFTIVIPIRNQVSWRGPQLGFTYDQEKRVGMASASNLLGAGALNNRFTVWLPYV